MMLFLYSFLKQIPINYQMMLDEKNAFENVFYHEKIVFSKNASCQGRKLVFATTVVSVFNFSIPYIFT